MLQLKARVMMFLVKTDYTILFAVFFQHLAVLTPDARDSVINGIIRKIINLFPRGT